MLSRLRNCLAALVLAGAAFPAAAHDGPLDPRFGDGGMRHYGFQSVNGSGRDDIAAAACPGPNGTLVVVGSASQATRIVTMRLLPNGDYDPSFGGGDGRESFPLAMTSHVSTLGLCQSDGKVLLARRLDVDASGEMNIQLIRVDGSSGLPDPSFGSGGVAMLDLDSWQVGLGKGELPLSLSTLGNGETLLAGYVRVSTGVAAFAARIAADGRVPVARVYADTLGRATAQFIQTAAVASDGTIWAIAEGRQPDDTRTTPFRVRLDRTTLEWIDVPDALPGTGPNIFAGRGVQVRPDVLAAPLMQRVAGSNPPRHLPALMIYRASGKVFVPLPEPAIAGETVSIGAAQYAQSVTVLPGGRVLYAAGVRRDGDTGDQATHLAIVRVGTAIGDDALETQFGTGGAQTAVFRPVGGSCNGSLVEQALTIGAFWNGLPVLAGFAQASCTEFNAGLDYVVTRLSVDRIFVDDFE